MSRLRVLVVDDSVTVRKRLCDILAADPNIELVGEAADGKQAIRLCLDTRPDVITMDMMMPVMTGLAATEYIMAHRPTPILVVSSSRNRSDLYKTYDALDAGAVDAFDKPSGDDAEEGWAGTFVATVKLVARIPVISRHRGPSGTSQRSANPVSAQGLHSGQPRASGTRPVIAALGASTGGPAALAAALRTLPPAFPLPILVVLHIGAPFADAFTDWLDAQSQRRVRYATPGESVQDAAGQVLVAPPGQHLSVSAGRIRLDNGPERHGCRPCIDVLFESLAQEYGQRAAACLLTGMGRDGAAGLLRIHAAGGLTIAQDEATCVVYGMPREAARLGAARHILPLEQIGPALAAAAMTGEEGRRP